MKLTRLFESQQTVTHPTDHSVIRSIMANIKSWEEGVEWVIMPGGIVVEGPDDEHGELKLTFPEQWDRIPVKFGDFPSAYYSLYRCKLKSLKNSPTTVKSMVLQGGSMANLLGGPRKIIDDLSVIDCALTSLTGAPESANRLMLRKLDRLTTLAGLEHMTVLSFEIQSCARLQSLNGMPRHIEHNVFINDLDSCEAIRFPQSTTMGPYGILYIGANVASKLSPTLVTVPGLMEIDWVSTSVGFRDDILRVFNKYLKLPKTTHTYLSLQTELIDLDMDWLAEL